MPSCITSAYHSTQWYVNNGTLNALQQQKAAEGKPDSTQQKAATYRKELQASLCCPSFIQKMADYCPELQWQLKQCRE